jgi:hypothetical protein
VGQSIMALILNCSHEHRNARSGAGLLEWRAMKKHVAHQCECPFRCGLREQLDNVSLLFMYEPAYTPCCTTRHMSCARRATDAWCHACARSVADSHIDVCDRMCTLQRMLAAGL